jgi:hypothetical protein
MPAKWTTMSGLASEKMRRAVSKSAMSACHQIGSPARRGRWERDVACSSRPSADKLRHTCWPMNPAAPVTSTRVPEAIGCAAVCIVLFRRFGTVLSERRHRMAATVASARSAESRCEPALGIRSVDQSHVASRTVPRQHPVAQVRSAPGCSRSAARSLSPK